MADDDQSTDTTPADLPEPVHQWLAAIADDQGVSQETLLHTLLTQNTDQFQPSEQPPLGTLEELRDEFQALVEDARRRIIQVKRETDEKAYRDHTHPQITDRLNDLATTVTELEDELTSLETTLDDGFNNYEDILEYLTDTTDSISNKLTTLANAVIDLQDQFDTLTEQHTEDAILDRLTNKANRNGVTHAKCDACNNRVYITLLHTPRCPECSELIRDIEINRRFFGSHTLETGSLPALEGETTNGSIDLSQLTSHPDIDFDPTTVLSGDATPDDTTDLSQDSDPPPETDHHDPTHTPEESDRS